MVDRCLARACRIDAEQHRSSFLASAEQPEEATRHKRHDQRSQSWRRGSDLTGHTQMAGGARRSTLCQVTLLDPSQDPVVHLAVDPTDATVAQ